VGRRRDKRRAQRGRDCQCGVALRNINHPPAVGRDATARQSIQHVSFR
jgi:hypothetical protein